MRCARCDGSGFLKSKDDNLVLPFLPCVECDGSGIGYCCEGEECAEAEPSP